MTETQHAFVQQPLHDEAVVAQVLGPAGTWRRLRTKEWLGFGITHRDIHIACLVQDAGYLASTTTYLHDRRSADLIQATRARPPGFVRMPLSLWAGRCAWETPGYRLAFDLSLQGGRHRVSLDLGPSRGTPAVHADLVLCADQGTAPLVVRSTLASGGILYTHKAIYPVEGTLRIGAETFEYDPSRDFAILDEQKTHFGYRTRWQWGTLAARTTEGQWWGANLADHDIEAGAAHESCLWLGSRIEPLGPIAFDSDPRDPMRPWRVSDASGRVRLAFHPQGCKAERLELGVVAVDYFQLCGRFVGVIEDSRGEVWSVDAWGVCERMRGRF